MRPRQFASTIRCREALEAAGIERESWHTHLAYDVVHSAAGCRPDIATPTALELWAEDPDRAIEALEASGLYVDRGAEAMRVWTEPAEEPEFDEVLDLDEETTLIMGIEAELHPCTMCRGTGPDRFPCAASFGVKCAVMDEEA